jgi:hypothetical protein
MRDVIRYSEAFKLRLVEDVAGGKIPEPFLISTARTVILCRPSNKNN